MEVQPQLVLLQKTLLNIEGLGRELYPDLDLWQSAKPILEHWMKEKLGWKAAMKTCNRKPRTGAETLPQMPRLLHDLSNKAQQGKLHVNLSSSDLEKLQQEIRQSSYRTAAATSGAAFLVGAAVMKGLDGYAPTMLGGLPILSWVFGIWGIALLYFSLSNRN